MAQCLGREMGHFNGLQLVTTLTHHSNVQIPKMRQLKSTNLKRKKINEDSSVWQDCIPHHDVEKGENELPVDT